MQMKEKFVNGSWTRGLQPFTVVFDFFKAYCKLIAQVPMLQSGVLGREIVSTTRSTVDVPSFLKL